MANASLAIFLIVFWTALWLFVKVDQLAHRRPLSEGPSFLPIVPVFTLIAFGIGWLFNGLISWVGTGIIAAIHVGYLFARGFSAWRDSKPSTK